jgi:transposase-like protein
MQAFLQEMSGVEVSPDLISTVTDAVVAEVTAGQTRPIEPLYPASRGMGDALEAVYPVTTRQTCLVHLMRQSLDLANWKEREVLAAALRPTLHGAERRQRGRGVGGLRDGPSGSRFPTIGKVWRRAWTAVIPFFAFPPDIRQVIDTTNALKRVHARIRKVIKTCGHYPTDDAALKLIWLALRHITAEWRRPAHHWRAALNQFAVLHEERFTKSLV